MILNYMVNHSQGDRSVLYTVGGQIVCESCFRMVYGFRYNRFSSMKSKFLDGVLIAEHGRLGRSETRDASVRVTSWLRTFTEKVGDRMPTSTDIHLPSCLTKSDVYALACDDLSQGGLECCQLSTFYSIWKRDFPNVKIPKVYHKIAWELTNIAIFNFRRAGFPSVTSVLPLKRPEKEL